MRSQRQQQQQPLSPPPPPSLRAQQRSPRKSHALQRPLQPLQHSGIAAPAAASSSSAVASAASASLYPISSSHPLAEMSAEMDARIAATETELEAMLLQSEPAEHARSTVTAAAHGLGGDGEGEGDGVGAGQHRPSLRLDVPSSHTPALSPSASSSSLPDIEIPLHVTVEPAAAVAEPRASGTTSATTAHLQLHLQRPKPARPQPTLSTTAAAPASISPSPPPPAASMLAPPAAARGRHARRESRFLAQAALLDLESEAAILAPRMTAAAAAAAAAAGSTYGGAGAGAAAPVAVAPMSLALTAALLHGSELPSTAAAAAALSDPVSLAALVAQPASAHPTGYSLLDGALARKKQRMADILNGISGLDGERKHMQPLPQSTHQLLLRVDADPSAGVSSGLSPFAPATGAPSAFSFSIPPISPRSAAADGVTLQLPSPRRGGHGHAHHRTLTGFDSSNRNSWSTLPCLPDAGDSLDEKQQLAASGSLSSSAASPRAAHAHAMRVPISTDIHGVEEDVTGAAIYHWLIDSPEALAAEDTAVANLLQRHQHQMAHRVPLEVQLRLARLHYKQAEGEFRPNLLEHAMEEAQKKQQQLQQQKQKQKELQRSGSQSARTAAGSSSSPNASMRPSPRSSRPHLLAPSDSLSSLHSIRSRGGGSLQLQLQGASKITFLTQSASDSSIALADHLASTASRGSGLANHAAPAALASVNDPYRARHVAFSYADRFEPLELAMLRESAAVLGGAFAGHESLAYVEPRTDVGRSSARKAAGATMYRKSRAHDVSLMAKSLASLAELNRGTPGPASYAAPPSSFDRAKLAHTRDGADSMGLGPSRLISAGHDANPRVEFLLKQASVGPGCYDTDQYTIARAAGMHAPRGSGGIHEFAGLSAAPPVSNEQIQARNARNKLAIELNRFDARMKEMRALTTKASPGPGAHTLRPPPAPPGSNSAVAYHARLAPAIEEEPSPGAGAYEAPPGIGGTTAVAGRHQQGSAGVATHFVGFGSSSSRTGLVAPSAASIPRDAAGHAGSAAVLPTRSELLVDFQRMPPLTKRDKALIAADEGWDRQSEALVAAAAAGGSASPATLPASRFGALLTADLLAASSASQALYQRRALVTLRPPSIIPATTMPWVILASKDENLKLAWLRDRAASNHVRRTEALQRHQLLVHERRERFLLLQSREAKIAARDALRVTQQRWLVLLVHGCVFGRYKSQHENDNRRARLLKAALVLQYYWRLKTARLVSSQRYQLLLAALRASFLRIVVGFRIRRRRRALGLVARFLGDHLATVASGMKSARKMLNVIQRFRAAVRTIQRFARACLRRWRAEVEMGCKQLARTELKENATLAAIALQHPASQFMPRSVREYALQTLRAARDRMDEDRLHGVRSIYAALETNKLPKGATPKQQKQLAEAATDSNSPRRASLSSSSSNNTTNSPRRPSTFMSQLAAGGVLVRSPGAGSVGGGKAKVQSIFTPQLHLAAHEGKAAAATQHSLGPEASLRLSDAVRRSIVAAACKVRRRRHFQDHLRQAEAEQSYLTRHGSALQSGIEIARVLLTGSSAKINQDRSVFARRFPPPFVHVLFAEGEMRALLLNAFFLQAHLDEERLAVSKLITAGQGRAAIHAARGLLTLALRQVLLRAPAGVHLSCAAAPDHVRLGTTLTAIHPGFQSGVPLALLNKDEHGADHLAGTAVTAHSHHHAHSHSHSQHVQFNNSTRPPSAHLSLPGAHGSSLSHGLAGSAQHHGGGGGGGGVGGSMLSHGLQGSTRAPREHDTAVAPPAHRGHAPSHSLAVPSGSSGGWHQSSSASASARLDEFSYKAHNHLIVGLIAFHSTLAAAIQFANDHVSGRGDVGAYPGVDAHADHLHAASLTHAPAAAVTAAASSEETEAAGAASDPFFHSKSHAAGMFPSVGLHVSRSAALKEAQRLSAQEHKDAAAASAMVRSPFGGKKQQQKKPKAAAAAPRQRQPRELHGSIDENADGGDAAIDDATDDHESAIAAAAAADSAAAAAQDSPFKPRTRKPSAAPSSAASGAFAGSTGASAAALSASQQVAPASNFALALAQRRKDAQRTAERAAYAEAMKAYTQPAAAAATATTAASATATPVSPLSNPSSSSGSISIAQPNSARSGRSRGKQQRH